MRLKAQWGSVRLDRPHRESQVVQAVHVYEESITVPRVRNQPSEEVTVSVAPGPCRLRELCGQESSVPVLLQYFTFEVQHNRTSEI